MKIKSCVSPFFSVVEHLGKFILSALIDSVGNP